MSTLAHLPEGQPIISPSQSFESYIAFRQCFDGEGDYYGLLEENEEHEFLQFLESAIDSGDLDREATLLRAILDKAVSAGVSILKTEGEQSLVGTADFTRNLQNLLKREYAVAAENVRKDNDYIPSFPLEEKRLIQTLLRGPNGKRAVTQIRQFLLADKEA